MRSTPLEQLQKASLPRCNSPAHLGCKAVRRTRLWAEMGPGRCWTSTEVGVATLTTSSRRFRRRHFVWRSSHPSYEGSCVKIKALKDDFRLKSFIGCFEVLRIAAATEVTVTFILNYFSFNWQLCVVLLLCCYYGVHLTLEPMLRTNFRVLILFWIKALWLLVPSHLSSCNQSECLISA